MKPLAFLDKYVIKKPAIRKALMKLFYRDKNTSIKFLETPLFVNTIKENGYYRAYLMSQYSSVFRDEASILINLSNFITSDTTFLDIGANVGLFSSTISRFRKLYPSLRIYAFEANPDTFNRLCQSVEQAQVVTYNIAVSDKDADLEFVEGAVSHVFSEVSHTNNYHYKGKKTTKIHARRLDSYPIVGDHLVLKIDVEGHELSVLKGAEKFFQDGRVAVVYLDSGFANYQEIIDLLTGFGFDLLNGQTLEKYTGEGSPLLATKRRILPAGQINNN